MSEQDELYPLTEEELNRAYMGSEYHPSFKMTLQVRHGIERVLAKVKQHYPIMYKEEAGFVGWLIDRGWIPPEEVRQKRLDRPELREKIARVIWTEGREDTGWLTSLAYVKKTGIPYELADQILALLIPDIEEVKKDAWKHLDAMLEEAKKQERERIGKLFEEAERWSMDSTNYKSKVLGIVDEFRQALREGK